MNIDLTPIIQALIGLIAVIITCYVVPLLKSKLGASKFETMNAVITMLVAAAEQIYTGSGRGDEKLNYVIAQLEERGFNVDKAIIEAQVKELFGKTDDTSK